ncbi:hypothetical protein RQCS_28610 [Rhodococcus qingshengii]|nr:hypothetical protein RQCS_28610 [Rhodococcus qingshengii]
MTGITVNTGQIRHAQAIVELCAGRPESLVSKEIDKQWMKYAVCWQAAYLDNAEVFQQANVQQVRQDNSTVTFGDRVYAVSPLVVEAVKRLSWYNSRKINLKGFNFNAPKIPEWWLW